MTAPASHAASFLEQGREVLAAQPFSRLLGAEWMQLAPGQCELAVDLREELLQQHGFAHGGVISQLADNALIDAGSEGASRARGQVPSGLPLRGVGDQRGRSKALGTGASHHRGLVGQGLSAASTGGGFLLMMLTSMACAGCRTWGGDREHGPGETRFIGFGALGLGRGAKRLTNQAAAVGGQPMMFRCDRHRGH